MEVSVDLIFQCYFPFSNKLLFRVIASGKTSATTGILTFAPQDSVYYKVFKNNMNEDSYSSKFGKSVKTNDSEGFRPFPGSC